MMEPGALFRPQTGSGFLYRAFVRRFNRFFSMIGLAERKDEYKAFLANFTYAALEKRTGVNRYYLWNIVNKPDYQPPAKVCAKLGIVRLEPAPVCEIHGKVCYCDCTTQQIKPLRQPAPPRARRAINLVDPVSAAATILTHADPAYIARLVELLNIGE